MEEAINMTSITNNNKVMTLDDARVELEREGLSCDLVANQRLVGVSSKCRWELTAKMDTVVFVQKVFGILTRQQFLADLKLLPSWIEEHVGGNDCPPFGFAHARLVMLVYYADTVEPAFGKEICQVARPKQWCASTFVVAQDAQGQPYYLDKANRPFWGSLFYPELCYRAQKLTGVVEEQLQPPNSLRWLGAIQILCFCYVAYICYLKPRLLPILVAMTLVQFLVAAMMQWWRIRPSPQIYTSDYGRLVESDDQDGIDSARTNQHRV
jgi:hypothetical protein